MQTGYSNLLYVGTYTDGKSKGIYAFRFATKPGTLSPIGLAAQTVNPSFLAAHPNHKFLYAVGEVKQYGGQPCGLVGAYAIVPESGMLSPLGEVSSRGSGPCQVSVDRTGKHAIVANYVGGSVAAFRILDNGRLGDVTALVQHVDSDSPMAKRRPHPHGAFFSADDRFIVVPDLGLDRVFIYRLDPSAGTLEPAGTPSITLPPGAGPRHFAFHPSGSRGYLINERDSTITAFRFDGASGTLQPFQVVSALPPGFSGDNATAEIAMDSEGMFLYGCNRGADSLAVYAIDPHGFLHLVEHVPSLGRTPRHFVIDPSGTCLIVANQDTNNMVLFRRDRSTGRIKPAGREYEINAPACLVFVPLP